MNIFISGAGSGIGEAMAWAFAKDAHKLILHAKSESGLPRVAEAILAKYPKVQVHCLYADLSTKEKRQTLLAELKSLLDDGLHILLNNAGVFLSCSCEAQDSPELLEYSWQINVASVLEVTRELLPLMRKTGAGHIFNMCSIASLRAYPQGLVYGISKYALKGFSDNLREELRAERIKVTTILPGATWSKSWTGMESLKSEMMQAEDLAKMAYMASKLSAQAVVEEIIMRPLVGDLQL